MSLQIDSVIIRRSPIVLLYKMIVATVLIYVASAVYSFMLFGETANALISIVSDKALFVILSIGGEALMMILLFLQWSFHKIEVHDTELKIRKGILWRRQEIHSLKNMQSVYVEQRFWGTLLGFGTITVHNPLSKKDITLTYVPDPDKYAQVLQDALDAIAPMSEKILPGDHSS